MTDPVILMVTGRVIERGLIVLGGILALWLGFRLFSLNSKEQSNAAMSGHGFSFKAERIGPGIFFALFGAGLLVHSTLTRINITRDDLQPVVDVRASQPSQVTQPVQQQQRTVIAGFVPGVSGDIPVSLKAVNTLISIKDRQGGGASDITGVDYQRLLKALPHLEAFQRTYVDSKLGDGIFDIVMAMEKECTQNTPRCRSYRSTQKNQDQMDEVRNILGTTLD